MPLETGNYIQDLNPANPAGGDPKSQGDDHIRLLKQVIVDSFPGFAGTVMLGGTSTGVDGAYVLTPLNPVLAYTANTIVAWKPNAVNTGVSTVNVSGLGTRNILQSDGAMLRAGDLSQYVLMIDTGTEYRIVGVTKNYVDQLVFSSALPGQPGTATEFELITKNNIASWSLRSAQKREVRSSNAQITVLDQYKAIQYSAGNFTQTWAAPALLTDGFNARVKNTSLDPVEVEAPAAVTTASGTYATFATATAYNIPAGLSIAVGDLVVVRRTALPFTQRMVATVASLTANSAQTISTITNVGAVATLTTSVAHGRTSGDTVTVSGATPAAYNGTFIITATGATTFNYTMLSTPASTALPVGSYTAGSTLNLTVSYRIDNSGISPATISTITAGGTIATLTTATAHGLVTGNVVTVAGATPAAFNGQFPITVTSPTTFTYTMASAPGGNATVVGTYTIQYSDWTITTRASTAGIDGKAAYMMYSGEERTFYCNGVALFSVINNGFVQDFTATGPVPKPPGYKSFSGAITAGGPSGCKSGNTAVGANGSGGAASLPFYVLDAFIPDAGTLVIGAGGIGPSAAASGTQGGNTTYAGMTIYGGGPGTTAAGGSGGGTLSAGVLGTITGLDGGVGSVGGAPRETLAGCSVNSNFGGANGTTSSGNGGDSIYGGGGGSAGIGGRSVYGGGAGGASISSAGNAGGISTFGGNGGAGGAAGASGLNGVAPGGAGGSTQTGAKAGDGARGQLRLKGEL